MKELLSDAERGGYAVGAFSIANMEMVMGVIKAAEELKSPAILQIAQVRLPYSPLKLIAPLMVAAAKEAAVPVAVHFDHGMTVDCIKQALDLGFTSVMIDASSKPIDENIVITKEVCELAGKYGATVEAEVGQLGRSEDGKGNLVPIYSDPAEVKRLHEETDADCIALSIGNAHGLYKEEPRLDFGVLKKAHEIAPVPLVLHGGSGISDEDFKKCINGGIRKINVATASFMAVEGAARQYAAEALKHDYFDLSDRMMLATYENVKRHMLVFGSENRA